MHRNVCKSSKYSKSFEIFEKVSQFNIFMKNLRSGFLEISFRPKMKLEFF